MKLVVLLSLMFLAVADCRRLGRCKVVRIFKAEGLEGFEGFGLGNYVCMAYWESRFKPNRVRDNNNAGKDYGIFQINSVKWCNDGTAGGQNLCNVECSELLKDDLKASVECAKVIVKAEGLKAWETWTKLCDGRKMSRWVRGCSLE